MYSNGSSNNGVHRIISRRVSMFTINIFRGINDGMFCTTNSSNYQQVKLEIMKFTKDETQIIMYLLGSAVYDYKEGTLLKAKIESMLGNAQNEGIWGHLPEIYECEDN